jgi:hypothetical protein
MVLHMFQQRFTCVTTHCNQGKEGKATMAAMASAPEYFYKLITKLIASLSETFPECEALVEKSAMLKAFDSSTMWELVMTEWQQNMEPAAIALLERRDPQLFSAYFDKHPLLSDICLSEKWSDKDVCNETRNTIWWYVVELTCVADPSCKDKLKGTAPKKRRPMKGGGASKVAAAAAAAAAAASSKAEAHFKDDKEDPVLVACASRVKAKLQLHYNEKTGMVKFNYKRLTELGTDPDIVTVLGGTGLIDIVKAFQPPTADAKATLKK